MKRVAIAVALMFALGLTFILGGAVGMHTQSQKLRACVELLELTSR